jgi:hypothetical protein
MQNNAPKKSMMMMMLIKSLPRWNLICSQASKEGLGVESPIAVTKNSNYLKWHMLFFSIGELKSLHQSGKEHFRKWWQDPAQFFFIMLILTHEVDFYQFWKTSVYLLTRFSIT